MNTAWTVGYKTADERSSVIKALRQSKDGLEVLKGVIDRRLKELTANSTEDYNVTNWPYLQADKLGSIRELQTILKLLSDFV